MLGPFRIRNLRRSASPPNHTSYYSPSRRGSLDAVVSVTGSEYDYNVHMHPESKLLYLDEDDGEIVTAGSSLELAQRLDDPVPMLSNPRTRIDRARSVRDSAFSALRAASADMHVFEIDRRGESVRIWEEIEQRTKSLQAAQAQVPSRSEPASKSVYPASNPGRDDQAREATSESKRSRTPLHQNPAPQFVPHYEDNFGAPLDESDDIDRRQELRGSRATTSADRYASNENILKRYFQASNPPKLSSETGDKGEQPTRHTSMRLSDVLNDDNEAKEVAQETEPLLVAYREGNLTEEGKRQAMEAGKRLRLRKYTYTAYQEKTRGSGRFQPPYDNRWASYNNTAPEPVDSSESRYEAPSAEPETHLPAPITKLQVPQEPEGSLLQAFRAELAKIITPNNHDTEKPSTPSVEPKPEGKDIQSVPVSTHAAPPPLHVSTTKLILQAINSICSNVTTLNSQLRHQVQDAIPARRIVAPSEFDVRGACLEFCVGTDRVIQEILHKELDSDVSAGESVQQTDADLLTNGVQCLRKVTAEFERLKDRLLATDPVKPEGDHSHGLYSRRQTYFVIDPIPQWAQAGDVVKFIRFSDKGLADVSSFLLSAEVVRPVNSRLPAALCTISPDGSLDTLRSLLARKFWDGLPLNMYCSPKHPFLKDRLGRQVIGQNDKQLKHHFPGEIGPDGIWEIACSFEYRPARISDESQKISSWGKLPAYATHLHDAKASTTEIDDSTRQEGAGLGIDPPISYRHVPSLTPWIPANPPRGRQPAEPSTSSSSRLPYEYLVPTTANDQQSKRRSVPITEPRRASRSRSRSPVTSHPRTSLDKPKHSPPQSNPTPTSCFQARDPVRHASLRSRRQGQVNDGPSEPRPLRSALRPFVSTNNLYHDYQSSGYQPLSQQRPSDGSTGVRFANTVEHTIDDPSHGQHRDHVRDRLRSGNATATTLRHSKSLGSIRKPHSLISGYQYDAEREDTAPRTSGTLREPFSDHMDHNTKLVSQANLVPETGNSNIAPPDSPLVPTRFPTLEQFEGRHRASAPQFPPLPSMEPLVPDRPNAPKVENKAQDNNDLPFAKASDPTSAKAYESAWPQNSSKPEKVESSGDFFRRMTGLAEPPKSPVRPVSPIRLSPAAPGARLIKPFDPLAETATIHRHQLIEGVRRSATVAGLHDRYISTNRRPYSAYFDGDGRVEWDQFIQGSRSNGRVMVQNGNGTSQRHPIQRARSERIPTSARAIVSESMPTHQDPTTVGVVQTCVEELKKLGFGKQEDGGMTRLVVYAQAANGNLEDAIDMIDEERKAWEERKEDAQ
ncbi:hypothetical protein MMC30_008462 [Trapelia coarctata]|nr:hypothetical protein [Trapelia coarctata]